MLSINEICQITIESLSVAVPYQKMEISSYKSLFGEETVDKFKEMTGVKSVHRAIAEQTASDLGYEAAKDVITKSCVPTSEIGLLVFVTQKPDYRLPSSAYVIHHRLGLDSGCSCFDINLACSGYIYALQTTMSMLQYCDKKYALVITGDTSVKTLSPADRTMVMLFGDSGTCTLLKKNSTSNFSSFFAFRTDGRRFKSIITPSGAFRNRGLNPERVLWSDDIERSDYDTHMKGMEVFGFSITDVPKLVKDFLAYRDKEVSDYDYFILHQANIYIIKQLIRKLKLPQEKVPISIDRFGNNSSNSIPLVLADHFGNISGTKFQSIMCGFGAGLSWACCEVELETDKINPIIFTDYFYREGGIGW